MARDEWFLISCPLIVFLVVMIAACLTTVTAALSPWPAVPLACAASCMLQVITGDSTLATRWTGTPRGLAADNVIDPARFHRAAR